MKHKGVGPVTALAFVLTIGPVGRFAHSRALVSYLGLNPPRGFQRRSSATGSHQQARQPDVALAAGGGRSQRGAV